MFEYGRTGRSLNVAVSTGTPVLGMDAATGAVVTDYVHLRDVTGDTLGYVIDPTADGLTACLRRPRTTRCGPGDVAMHLLPPGCGLRLRDDDAVARTGRPSAKPSRRSHVSGDRDRLDAGPLYLAGGIVGDPAGSR